MLDRKKVSIGVLIFIPLLSLGLVASNGTITSSSTHTSALPWSDLRGADYQPAVLCGCYVGSITPPTSAFSEIKNNGWNLIKVYLAWSTLETDPSYISSLKQIASAAQSQGIYVIYTLGATANTAEVCSNIYVGNVWPCFMIAAYGGAPNQQFWGDLWANKIIYKGTDSWTAQWNNFWIPIIYAVDSNPSTLGYEIMNEPLNPGGSPLSQLQQYNQFFATKIHSISQKTIMFMGPCPSCGYDLSTSTPVAVAPTGMNNIAIDFHNYYDFSYGQNVAQYFAAYSQVSKSLGNIPVLIGEWAICGISYPDTCATMTESQAPQVVQTYESGFNQYGFANTYFAWECGSGFWGLLLKTSCSQYWLDSDIVQYQSTITTTTISKTTTQTTTSSTSSSTHTTSSTSSTSSSTTISSSSITTSSSSSFSSTSSMTTTTSSSSSSFSSSTSSTQSSFSSSTSTQSSLSSSTSSTQSSNSSTPSLTSSSTSAQVASSSSISSLIASSSSTDSGERSESNPIVRTLAALSPAKNPPVAYGFASYEICLIGALGYVLISIRRVVVEDNWRW